jgi:hypothetical protein
MMQQLAGDGADWHLQIWDRRRRRRFLPKKDSQQLLRDFCWRLSKRVFLFLCVRGGGGGGIAMRRILFLAAKIQEELGSLHVLPDFLLLHAMIAPPLWQARKGAGITAALILQRTSGSLYFPPNKSRHQRTVSSGHFPPRNQTIGQCRVFQKKGQKKQNWPESKGSASAGYFKKEGQNQKNWRFRVFPNSSTNPTWLSLLTSRNK